MKLIFHCSIIRFTELTFLKILRYSKTYKTPSMISDDILDIKDAANYLRLPVSTIYRLAQDGRVPAVKVGKHWRFLRKNLQLLFAQKEEEHFQIPEY